MAESSRHDISSASPDRPLSGTGQRGNYLTAPLDRSASFREGVDVGMSSASTTLARGNSSVTQSDIQNFFGSLRLDLKSAAADHKVHRGDLKRYLSSATGISLEDSPSSSKSRVPPSVEELKRIKSGLRENSIKARERAKFFSEALSTFGKVFPNVPSRKRSRLDVSIGDRPIISLSNHRPAVGTSLGKLGSQNALNGVFSEQKKSMERIKNPIPSRRTRTSLLGVDARAAFSARAATDRDGEAVKLGNGGAQAEDRMLSTGGEGWEKSKMKKKRSAIKPDLPSGASSPRSIDGFREHKQKSLSDARKKLNESRASRPGIPNGVGSGKFDGVTQQSVSATRCFNPRTESDPNSTLIDRMSRPTTAADTERANVRQMNKANVRDDFSSACPNTNLKVGTCVRAPRSSSLVPKPSTVARSASNDWELLQCSGGSNGNANRKRMSGIRPSSPSLAPQWGGQRPQKISRIARRTNFGPIISSNEDMHTSDSVSDAGNDNATAAMHVPAHASQHMKPASDHFSSPTTFSESEESGSADLKCRDNNKGKIQSDEMMNTRDGSSIKKGFPSRKNKLIHGGDGVRRQGRSGRGFASRSLIPLTDHHNGDLEKQQLINVRTDTEKSERMRRPSTRKPPERKAYAARLLKHSVISTATDFHDDGCKELLAAASAVINPSTSGLPCESFWKQVEPLFRFICDSDINYLKHQITVRGMDDMMTTGALMRSVESMSDVGKAATPPPLFERVLAALISVEDCEELEDTVVVSDAAEFDLDDDIVDWQIQSLNSHTSSVMTSLNSVTPTRNGYVNHHHDHHRLSELQYCDLSLDERVLLEIHSIGIFPDLTFGKEQSAEEEITESIQKLEERYHQQVSRNKERLSELLKSALAGRETQEREFECSALDKLVGMTYEKYMTSCSRERQQAGEKKSGGKLGRQVALASVKRTIERCRKFEETGKSCFSESTFRDMLHSASPDDASDFLLSSPPPRRDEPRAENRKRDFLLDDDDDDDGAAVPPEAMSRSVDEIVMNVLEGSEPIDLSGLQIPEIDGLNIPDGLGGQAEDLSSWLNIDDDGLQDHDFMGLEIPMDDLSDLNMVI